MNKYRFLNHPDGKLDIVDAQVTFTDKTFEINFQKKVINPELEISKPLYIDLNEIQ